MPELRMPVLGADMEVGTVSQWLVQVGDRVRRGDVVAVIETDKSDIDAEAFDDGIVREIVVPVGLEVPVGTVLAVLDPVDAATEQPIARPPEDAHGTTPTEPAPPRTWSEPPVVPGLVASPVVRHLAEREGVDPSTLVGTGPGHRVTRADVEHAAPPAHPPSARARATPLARRRARDHGIDLAGIDGSGPGGAVVAADVEQATARRATPPATPPTAPPAGGTDREPSARRAVARLMARSKREIPHYYLQQTIDLGAMRAWLDVENGRRSIDDRLVPAAVLLTAVARAAARAPRMNGHWIAGQLVSADRVDLGVAISRPEGLIAPPIPGADGLDVDEVMARMRGLVERARAGRLRSSDLGEPTITVTNLGDRGADVVFGVISPPQVALVGFGAVADRPVVHDGTVVARPTVVATLAADHRASDGHDGARFLRAVDHLLQHPDRLG